VDLYVIQVIIWLKVAFHDVYNYYMYRFWEPTYEDVLNLIARLPPVASYVYRRIFKDGKSIEADNSLDYAANFSHMLGFDDPKMLELMRLYITIHT